MGREALINECENYHPDMELEGSGNLDYGHNLAERLINYFPKVDNLPLMSEDISKETWKKFCEVIENEKSPDQIYNQPAIRKNLKGVLGRLKKAGMEIKDYSKMDNVGMMRYFCKIRREIRSHCF